MKKHYMIIAVIVISGLLAVYQVVHFIRYRSFSKYNIWPAQTIENYLESTYGGSYTLTSTNFYGGGPYNVWELQYKDEDGLLFCEYYQAAYDGPNGLELYLNHERGEMDIIDLYWQAKLNEVFEEKFGLGAYNVDCDFRTGNNSLKYNFNIDNKADIEYFSDVIATIYDYTNLHVKSPSSKILSCGVTYRGTDVCEMRYQKEWNDDRSLKKESLKKYVKNKIEMELAALAKKIE